MSHREPDIEEQVRQRAYELWEEAGRPEGRGDEFWHEAWTDITSGSEPVTTAAIGATASAEPQSKEGPSKSAEPTA